MRRCGGRQKVGREREKGRGKNGVMETKKKPRILQMNRDERQLILSQRAAIRWSPLLGACTAVCTPLNRLFQATVAFFKLVQTRWEKTCGNSGGTEACTATCWTTGKLRTIDLHWKCKLWHVNNYKHAKMHPSLTFSVHAAKSSSIHSLRFFSLLYTVDADNYE